MSTLHRFHLACCFAVLLAISPSATRGDEASTTTDAAAITRLIKQLDSDDFATREAATADLINFGKAVVAPLAKAADQGPPEVSWRAVHALLELALSQDMEAVDQAEEALMSLRGSSNTIASDRARNGFESLNPTRQARAFTALTHLGAKVTEETESVMFDDAWTGGDAGLKHLRRLVTLRQISIEPTAKITDEAVERLKRDLPGTKVLKFGTAFLGVGTASASDDQEGLVVMTVITEGAGAKAGLAEQDVIYRIDGQKVDTFDDMVNIIRSKHAGDEVEIEYLSRAQGTRVKKKTTLGARPGVKKDE